MPWQLYLKIPFDHYIVASAVLVTMWPYASFDAYHDSMNGVLRIESCTGTRSFLLWRSWCFDVRLAHADAGYSIFTIQSLRWVPVFLAFPAHFFVQALLSLQWRSQNKNRRMLLQCQHRHIASYCQSVLIYAFWGLKAGYGYIAEEPKVTLRARCQSSSWSFMDGPSQ